MNSESKTVLVVTPYFPPYGGGLERYAYEISQRLQAAHGWRIVVVTSGKYRGEDIQETVGDLTVYRLGFEIKLSNTPFSFKWSKKIHTILRAEKPVIVHIHMPVPGIGDVAASVSGKLPVIITYHAGTMRKGKFLVDILIWIYESTFLQILLHRADSIVCGSNYVRDGFLKRFRRKSITITPAVDSKIFKPRESGDQQSNNVLFVAGLGRSHQHKGLKTLIDAVKKVKMSSMPDIQLTVVGDGDMRPEYEAYAVQRGLRENVRFAGRLAGANLVNAYQNASMIVLPSSAPAESFGMVLLEGLACKKPAIGTNMGGIPEVIDHEKNGLLVPPDDPVALSVAIERLVLNKELAEHLGETGFQKVRNGFSWDKQADAYHSLYLKMQEKKI